MPKFRVCIPYTERIIEADNEEDAEQRFEDDETIYYTIEAEPIDEPPGFWKELSGEKKP